MVQDLKLERTVRVFLSTICSTKGQEEGKNLKMNAAGRHVLKRTNNEEQKIRNSGGKEQIA